jgi:hypothetical protein
MLAAVTKPAPDRRDRLISHDTFAGTRLVTVIQETDPSARARAAPTMDQKAANRVGGTWVSQNAKNTVS